MMESRKKRLILNTCSSLIFQVITIVCGFILPRLILEAFGSAVNFETGKDFINLCNFIDGDLPISCTSKFWIYIYIYYDCGYKY